MRRAALLMVLVTVLLAAPASADHGPTYAVRCPIPSAQVVLDPGHGGPDPGAVNDQFGLLEADLVLDIARRVAEILRTEHGYVVALTRHDSVTELANSERGEIANACSAAVFVEIHLNAAEDRSVNYAQTFWAVKEKDIVLSQVMSAALSSLNIPVNAIDRFDNGGLLRAKMPSVLVEAVFLSNTEEADALSQGTRQDDIARAVAHGISSWFGLQ